MPTLSGMPGVRKGKKIEAAWGSTPADFIKALRTHRAITCAGDQGCVTVYIDDKGIKRGYFSRFLSVSHEQAFKSGAELSRWLKDVLPLRHGGEFS